MRNAFENSMQDFRYAIRQLRKSLGFTLMAAGTLALGIGAATAVFSLVDTVLLHQLPFPEPDRIVALDTLSTRAGGGPAATPSDTSYPNFFDWRQRAKSFTALASWQGGNFTLAPLGGAAARRLDGMTVSSDFFRVLGVAPAEGRDFRPTEEAAGTRSVILSHRLATTASAAPGATLRLNDETYTVVGVLPAGFHFPNAPDSDVWVTPSLAMEGKNPSGQQRGWNQLSVLGRLAPGASIEQARAEMQTIQHSLAADYPDDNKNQTSVSVVSEMEDLTGDIARPLNILFSAVCFLLLIACANVAGLLLTRSAARRPELALRSALGATRMQIVRQLLIESLTLSLASGAVGLALAAAALKAAPRFLPTDLPRLEELSLNPRVFLFALAASVLTGLLFGVLPAWRSSRLDPALALRDNARGSTSGRGRGRLHATLVIGETALGLTLLVGAGLLIRSFDRLLSVDPGFNTGHLLTFRVSMPGKRFAGEKENKLVQFVQQVQGRLAALPGAQQATYGFPMPLAGTNMSITFTIDGRLTAQGDEPSARASIVPANFFSAMQMSLRRGRFFSSSEDQPDGPPVIIVNQAFADLYFPGENAVGKRIASDLSSDEKTGKAIMREIVGVVGNVNRESLTETAQPEYYLPYAQAPVGPPVYALRVAGDPAAYEQTVRALVAQIDPSLPVFAVRTNLLTRSTAEQRFQTLLLSGFAVLALVLAAIGLYAVITTMVAERTMELGLRMALGAQRGDVLSLVLGRGLVLSGIGLAVGLAASFALTRFLATLLFRTPATDPTTFAAMTMVLFSVSIASCFVPAWRASRLNPNETLRQQ